MSAIYNFPKLKGSYALILGPYRKGAAGSVAIGRLGTLALQWGYYLYVGSAFGSGGLAARLKHHLHSTARPHWHIDYLKEHLAPVEVWVTTDPVSQEHRWARLLLENPHSTAPLAGFGSSDCECASHLFFFTELPCFEWFRQQAGAHLADHRSEIERYTQW